MNCALQYRSDIQIQAIFWVFLYLTQTQQSVSHLKLLNSSFYYLITKMHKIAIILLLLISTIGFSSAYTFGMLSHDDTIESIKSIEHEHNMTLAMVSYIWDDYDAQAQGVISKLWSELGTGRIYHITLSPRMYNSKQVAWGYFDWEYGLFFKNIKNSGLKVVFRTMHEMNGGWYPWSWDPTSFKQARIHIYQLSRDAGLDQSQILFDFSTNGWDMPPQNNATPSQTTPLIKCTQRMKYNKWCLTREDYYPGDAYVDMMWVTFYNWGKATSDRQRLSPKQIMEESQFSIRNRIVKQNKPIIIDEVGTTSVWYDTWYNRTQSLNQYRNDSGILIKNRRLAQLSTRASSKPQLAALSYFNVDRTMWLARENPGEADRSVIDLDNGKYYTNILKLYSTSDDTLSKLFVTPADKKKEHIGDWSGVRKRK